MDDLLCNPLPKNKIEKEKMRKVLLPDSIAPFARKLRNYKPKLVVVVIKSIDSYVNEAIEKSKLAIDACEVVGFPYKYNGIIRPQTISEAQYVLTKLKQLNFIDQ